MEVNAPTVRHVLGKLSKSQLEKIKTYSETQKFSHSWYWHGPEGDAGMRYEDIQGNLAAQELRMCALAVAFDVERSVQPGHFWGAKVNDNLMKAMGHLSESAGGDVGTVNYILELSKLSHEELVSVVDDALSGAGSLDAFVMPTTVRDAFLDRTPPSLKSRDQVTTLRRVLSALSNKQLGKLLEYSLENSFHHGWYWFGPEGAVGVVSHEERFAGEGLGDPIAIAFDLTPSRDATSWRGCKLDEKFIDALAFWSEHAGGEVGMEAYVVELNSLSSEELRLLICSIAARALQL